MSLLLSLQLNSERACETYSELLERQKMLQGRCMQVMFLNLKNGRQNNRSETVPGPSLQIQRVLKAVDNFAD